MTALAAIEDQSHRLSPARIAAYSGALAVHAVALAFLLLPITYEHVAKPLVVDPIWIDWVEPPKPIPPIPPAPVHPPQQQTPRASHQRVVVDTPVPNPIHVEHQETFTPTDVPIDNSQETVIGQIDAPTLPAPSVQVAYIYAPITYPNSLLRQRVEGTVMLKVLVDREGKPAKIELQKSSGNRELDRSALSQVTRWKFKPAVKDGKEVEVWAIVPVNFSIDRA